MPEVGVYTPRTAAYIKERLTEMGIAHRDCGVHSQEDREKMVFAGYPAAPTSTGVVAVIGKGGPCILLRADMDGLPMEETTGLDFAAKGATAHMCGHAAHAAMLLGAARILKEMEDELPGTVKLMFQPGEEMGYGSRTMVEAGLLKPELALAKKYDLPSETPEDLAAICEKYMPEMVQLTAQAGLR